MYINLSKYVNTIINVYFPVWTCSACGSRQFPAQIFVYFTISSIYTTQILPKTVACNLLTTRVELCKSSTQLAYVVLLIYTVQPKLSTGCIRQLNAQVLQCRYNIEIYHPGLAKGVTRIPLIYSILAQYTSRTSRAQIPGSVSVPEHQSWVNIRYFIPEF